MKLKLNHIFVLEPKKPEYTKNELSALALQDSFISLFSKHTMLIYDEGSGGEGNLCFANDRDVRPEFRTTFRKADVVKYIFDHCERDTVNPELEEITLPQNLISFWK